MQRNETVNKTAVVASVIAPVVGAGIVAAPYVAGVVGSDGVAAVGKEFLKSTAGEVKKAPLKSAVKATVKGYSAGK